MLRALARVDVAAIERNCARLAARPAPARAVRGRQGRRLRPRGGRRRARRARGRRGLARRRHRRRGGASCAPRGIDGPVLVMGALGAEELAGRAGRRADVVAWREDFVAALPRRCRASSRQARHRHGPARHARPGEALAVAAPVAAAPGLRLGRRDDPLRDRRRRSRRSWPSSSRAFAPWAERCARSSPASSCTPPTPPPPCACPTPRFDMVRCGIAVYGMDPFQRDPAAHGLEPALTLVSYVAEVKPIAPGQSAGYGRRFVAPGADLDRHAADRLRGRHAARADEQRRRARRRPPPAARRHRVDGQRHDRPRPGRRRGGPPRRAAVAASAPRAASGSSSRSSPSASARSTTRSPRESSARVPRHYVRSS